jgi:ADP-heptose:LPS heptosyltransferase
MKVLSLTKKAICEPSKIPLAVRIELRSLSVILRHGLPDVMLQFLGGIGDELLLTAVAHELKRRSPNLCIWQISHSAELLDQNPNYSKVFNWNNWPLRYSNILNNRRLKIDGYATPVIPGEQYVPPTEHIIAVMCRRAGITGQISIKPDLFLSETEKRKGSFAKGAIVIHYPGEKTYAHMKKNKLWDFHKFQRVVKAIAAGSIDGKKYSIIQLGSPEDPLSDGIIDLRGRTTLRESAAILHNCEMFLGHVGFLMHLARAVDCRAVVIYGGHEHSFQSGYICNENLDSHVDCAPCWRWNTCDFGRKCMEMVSIDDVLGAVQKVASRKGMPLETQTVVI